MFLIRPTNPLTINESLLKLVPKLNKKFKVEFIYDLTFYQLQYKAEGSKEFQGIFDLQPQFQIEKNQIKLSSVALIHYKLPYFVKNSEMYKDLLELIYKLCGESEIIDLYTLDSQKINSKIPFANLAETFKISTDQKEADFDAINENVKQWKNFEDLIEYASKRGDGYKAFCIRAYMSYLIQKQELTNEITSNALSEILKLKEVIKDRYLFEKVFYYTFLVVKDAGSGVMPYMSRETVINEYYETVTSFDLHEDSSQFLLYSLMNHIVRAHMDLAKEKIEQLLTTLPKHFLLRPEFEAIFTFQVTGDHLKVLNVYTHFEKELRETRDRYTALNQPFDKFMNFYKQSIVGYTLKNLSLWDKIFNWRLTIGALSNRNKASLLALVAALLPAIYAMASYALRAASLSSAEDTLYVDSSKTSDIATGFFFMLFFAFGWLPALAVHHIAIHLFASKNGLKLTVWRTIYMTVLAVMTLLVYLFSYALQRELAVDGTALRFTKDTLYLGYDEYKYSDVKSFEIEISNCGTSCVRPKLYVVTDDGNDYDFYIHDFVRKDRSVPIVSSPGGDTTYCTLIGFIEQTAEENDIELIIGTLTENMIKNQYKCNYVRD